MRRIFELVRKELIQTFRDKRMLGLIFVAPVLQLIMLGYAVTTDVKHIALGVRDTDRSQESRELVRKAVISGYFDDAGVVENDAAMEHAFKSGRCDLILYFPPDYSKNIKQVATRLEALFGAMLEPVARQSMI